MGKMNIMIVEDDLILAMGLEQDLIAMGYHVVGNEAKSDEALNTFKIANPDLILMDIDLAGSQLDGIELTREIKKTKDIPIIFLSALGGKETIERAKEVNPSYYLIKPCNKRQIQIAIDFALSNFISKEHPHVDHSLKTHEPLSHVIFSRSDFFFVKKEQHYHRINIKDIVYVKAEGPGNNIRIITDYDDHFLAIGLKNFEDQVHHPNLLRIHRSFIINMEKIVGFNGNEVILNIQIKQEKLSIGNTYREKFMNMFLRLKSD